MHLNKRPRTSNGVYELQHGKSYNYADESSEGQILIVLQREPLSLVELLEVFSLRLDGMSRDVEEQFDRMINKDSDDYIENLLIKLMGDGLVREKYS